MVQSAQFKFAQVISNLFNPWVVPGFAFVVLAWTGRGMNALLLGLVILVAILFSTVTIYAYIYYLKQKGAIDSTDLVRREHRISPLTFAVMSYAVGYLLLTALSAPELIRGLMFCYATNTIAVLVITRSWKISLHTTGISAPLVVLTYAFGWRMLPFYALIPLVGSARIVMQRHNLLQVMAGAFLGITMTALQVYLFFNPYYV
jgi:membrane-associated phospholipid phosphatase